MKKSNGFIGKYKKDRTISFIEKITGKKMPKYTKLLIELLKPLENKEFVGFGRKNNPILIEKKKD